MELNIDKVYVLILNWNSWNDTITCIESVLKSEFNNYQIIIVDNNSTDNSVHFIEKYLNRELIPYINKSETLYKKIFPIFNGKLPYVIYSEQEAIIGGNIIREKKLKLPSGLAYPVIIIKNNENYGFAKGNNTALKFALSRDDFSYIWLLNNDTVIEKNTLSNLIKEAKKDKKIGFVGSVIRYYDNPEYIQTIGGGSFYPLLGMGKLYMKNKHISIIRNLNNEDINNKIDYIMGASLLIKKEVLQDVGIFDENFFLYAEELDLIKRGKTKGWKLSVSLDSYVYHKDSASTKDKKWLYYYLISKSNMIFLRKHYNLIYNIIAVPFLILSTLIISRKFENIKATWKGIKEGLLKRN